MLNVLIPTDFSVNSENAIAYAISFFKEQPCCFHLVHVTENDLQKSSNSEINTAKSNLQKQLQLIKKSSDNTNHKVLVRLIQGKLIEVIKNEVENKGINLIIMATNGLSNPTKNKVGSNTIDVISKVKCNVIIVPQNATFNGLHDFTLVSDYSIFLGTEILKTISMFIQMYSSTLHIVHLMKSKEIISQDQIQNKESLRDYFREDNHFFHTLTNKNPNAAIQDFVDNKAINLIAIAAKNIHLYQQLLFNTTKQTTDYQIKTPFLVLHE